MFFQFAAAACAPGNPESLWLLGGLLPVHLPNRHLNRLLIFLAHLLRMHQATLMRCSCLEGCC
jgi:hypothetical protein